MHKYWILVQETAEFMEDYLVYDIAEVKCETKINQNV